MGTQILLFLFSNIKVKCDWLRTCCRPFCLLILFLNLLSFFKNNCVCSIAWCVRGEACVPWLTRECEKKTWWIQLSALHLICAPEIQLRPAGFQLGVASIFNCWTISLALHFMLLNIRRISTLIKINWQLLAFHFPTNNLIKVYRTSRKSICLKHTMRRFAAHLLKFSSGTFFATSPTFLTSITSPVLGNCSPSPVTTNLHFQDDACK